MTGFGHSSLSSLKRNHGRDPFNSGHFDEAKLARRTNQKQQSVPRSFCSRFAWDTYAFRVLIYIIKIWCSKSLVGPEGLEPPTNPL